jgi:hypothetical protein
MSKMSFRATFPAANDANTPFKIFLKVRMGTLFKLVPLLLYIGFQFRKELLDWIQIG